MGKRTINKEQFKKLVISEAKKFIKENKILATEKDIAPKSKKIITFDKVESLIKEMEQIPKSITLIKFDNEVSDNSIDILDEPRKPNRSLDINEHNKKKNIIHVNEGEQDKWNRMLSYKIPSDDER